MHNGHVLSQTDDRQADIQHIQTETGSVARVAQARWVCEVVADAMSPMAEARSKPDRARIAAQSKETQVGVYVDR